MFLPLAPKGGGANVRRSAPPRPPSQRPCRHACLRLTRHHLRVRHRRPPLQTIRRNDEISGKLAGRTARRNSRVVQLTK